LGSTGIVLQNVRKHVLLISSYLGHIPVISSSKTSKIFKIVLGSTGLDLQMLQSMFC
jgi:hypothetical protein